MAQQWTKYRLEAIAIDAETQAKADRLFADFCSLLKANGIHGNFEESSVSGHRNTPEHGRMREWPKSVGGVEVKRGPFEFERFPVK